MFNTKSNPDVNNVSILTFGCNKCTTLKQDLNTETLGAGREEGDCVLSTQFFYKTKSALKYSLLI